jgi:hypothetical protein
VVTWPVCRIVVVPAWARHGMCELSLRFTSVTFRYLEFCFTGKCIFLFVFLMCYFSRLGLPTFILSYLKFTYISQIYHLSTIIQLFSFLYTRTISSFLSSHLIVRSLYFRLCVSVYFQITSGNRMRDQMK